MCSSFRRGAGAENGGVPQPNRQTAPCVRGISRQDEKTCWRSGRLPLSRETSQTASAGKDSSMASTDSPGPHSSSSVVSLTLSFALGEPPNPRCLDSRVGKVLWKKELMHEPPVHVPWLDCKRTHPPSPRNLGTEVCRKDTPNTRHIPYCGFLCFARILLYRPAQPRSSIYARSPPISRNLFKITTAIPRAGTKA
jgi:hypothetical protein